MFNFEFLQETMLSQFLALSREQAPMTGISMSGISMSGPSLTGLSMSGLFMAG